MIEPGQHATQMPSTREPIEQNRDNLIHNLHQEYSRQLEHSLRGVAMVAVGLHEGIAVNQSSMSSMPLVLHWSSNTAENPLPVSTSIIQAYEDAGRRLLILGEPGAGKTTLLLELACELLARAKGDSTLPIPVILNLSSWASQKPPLESWLIEQLQLVYHIPSRLGQAWLEEDSWVWLLDGLDEVGEALRPACIEAINAYRGEEHSTPLVVCSRSHEYLAQESQLALSNTVCVQPLQGEQVTACLEQLGESVAGIREVVRSNPTLRQLITTPLMLHAIILAYQGETNIDLPQSSSPEEQQQQIFDHYIERMFNQRTAREQFTPQRTRHWLIWLAQQMKQRHLTEFYLEWLQPSWLRTERSQVQYRLFYMLVYGLVLGLIYGLVGKLMGELVYGLIYGLVGGLILGLFGGLMDDISIVRPAQVLTWSWKAVWRGLFTGLDDVKKIRPVEGLRWSWNSLWQGGIVGLVVGLITWLIGFGVVGGVIIGLITGLLGWLIVEFLGGLLARLTYGLISGVVREMSGEQINKDMRLVPNRGIRGSGWKALSFGLIGGLIGGLIVGLIMGRMAGTGATRGLFLGVFLGVFLAALIAQVMGARAYACHYILRYILYRNGAMPWHYVRFLERATETSLLQRAGSGYRFIHPLFVDYFASQGTECLESADAMNRVGGRDKSGPYLVSQ